MSVRSKWRGYLDRRLERRLAPMSEEDWTASAMVIAPHPDDEILGCGGVSLKKMQRGSEVRFVFVTSGGASHVGHIDPGKLAALREEEAVEAVCRLGAPREHVSFLGLPDGGVSQHVGRAAELIAGLLERWRPASVLLVHARDVTPDHIAVNRSARRALRAYGARTTVLEYPVWYWFHWPWVRVAKGVPGMWRTAARQTARTFAGMRATSHFNVRADVSDVISAKIDALAAHRSQMLRLDGSADWITLGDLAGGDFLSQLLRDYEVFARYEANP